MNKINLSKVIMMLAATLFLFVSCHPELDVAPVATYDGQATHTIAQLLTYHPITNGFTYDTLPQGIVIEGTVISSDEQGNCYKYITIDDGTAAIQVKINSSTLYTNYPLGQHLFIKCDGLVLGDYGMLHQLGWWENDGMQGINTNKIYKYIFKDGTPGPNPEPSIELSSANQIQDNMYGRLVRLKDVHFTVPGLVYAGTTSSGTENEISFKDGTKIILYTSMYAKFASQLTPDGTFDMIALLSRFRSTKQLVIRSLDDIGPVIKEVEIYNADFSQNPLEHGWLTHAFSGNEWSYIQGNAMSISGTINATTFSDSWLISPAFDMTAYSNMTVSFTHRSIGGTSNRQVFYSTNYSGDVQTATWIPLDVTNYSTSFLTYTQALPADALNSNNLRFAFQYTDYTNSIWLLSSFKLVSFVQQ